MEIESIIGVGSTVIITVSNADKQGPVGSSVVKVKVIVPVKLAGGVKVEFNAEESEKVPPPDDVQLAVDAAPPIVPLKVKTAFSHNGA